MAEPQYNRYNNLHIFAKEWRGYKVVNKPLDMTTFRNTMQTEEYVTIKCLDTVNSREVIIYLVEPESKYAKTTYEIKKILNKIKNKADVIFVTYRPFNIYGKKALASPDYKHLTIYTYLHEIFDIIIPNGPLCYPHRVMSRAEVLQLCNDELYCYIENLPKIFDEDPQCIWIGAKGGDVIEIKISSDICGIVYQYKTVVPKNGRMIYAKDLEKKEVVAVEDVEDVEEHDKPDILDIDDNDDDDDED
jgi:DNA-directed RNA polymerase subunit H (RpoH/RPB5)